MKTPETPPPSPRLQIYTGDGKGKTTACVGLTVRALGAGLRAAFIQFDKGYDGTNEHYAERFILRMLPKLTLTPTGCERMRPDGTFRFTNEPEDYAEAARHVKEYLGRFGVSELKSYREQADWLKAKGQ